MSNESNAPEQIWTLWPQMIYSTTPGGGSGIEYVRADALADNPAPKCAGLKGCQVLEAAVSEMFIHDERCPKGRAGDNSAPADAEAQAREIVKGYAPELHPIVAEQLEGRITDAILQSRAADNARIAELETERDKFSKLADVRLESYVALRTGIAAKVFDRAIDVVRVTWATTSVGKVDITQQAEYERNAILNALETAKAEYLKEQK